MKVFHSRYTGAYYKNRIEAINHVAGKYYMINREQSPDRVRAVLVNEVDIGILKKQEIVDLMNGKPSRDYTGSVVTVAKIWLEGSKGNLTVVCREKAQTGIVYRNIKHD